MNRSESWLDTKTKELLGKGPPVVEAPAEVCGFSLVLLKGGEDRGRMIRAVERINKCGPEDADELLGPVEPVIINPDLSQADALLGQFELICCDAVSVFVSSEVVEEAEPSYLDELYSKLLQSCEFEDVTVTVWSVPQSEEGGRFMDQFIDVNDPGDVEFPLVLHVLSKKARIMSHWAQRVGVEIQYKDRPC